MLKVLGINGSPRKGGNSDTLLKYVLTGAERGGCATEAINLCDYRFQGCIGCEKCRQDKACTGVRDDMQLIYPKIEESKGLVLVSPTHNYNVTAWMKAFIDRLYCFYNFTDERPGEWSSRLAGQGRAAIIASIGEQENYEDGVGFTLDAMRRPVEALGFEVITQLPVLGTFLKKAITKQPELLLKTEELGKQLAVRLKDA